jgi:hypothetical protein
MAIAITCPCSARLEVDEKFAGQSITCPDCQNSLQVPQPAGATAQRTSYLALASLVLALVGAVTILGTMLAVACGLAALLQIRRQPDRLAGSQFAWAGIVLGVVLTGLSAFAFSAPELFGVDPAMRRLRWLGKLEFKNDLEVKREREGFKIRRPSQEWGVFVPEAVRGRRESDLRDLLIVQPARPAYILVLVEKVPAQSSMDFCKDRGLQIFRDVDLTSGSLQRGAATGVKLVPARNARLFTKGQLEILEMKVDKTARGLTRTYLLQIIKKTNDDLMYVVAAGTDKIHFADVEPELREGLDSFEVIERALPDNRPLPPGDFGFPP